MCWCLPLAGSFVLEVQIAPLESGTQTSVLETVWPFCEGIRAVSFPLHSRLVGNSILVLKITPSVFGARTLSLLAVRLHSMAIKDMSEH